MEEATTQLHRIVSTIQNELTHSSRPHVRRACRSQCQMCSARFQPAWSIEAWPCIGAGLNAAALQDRTRYIATGSGTHGLRRARLRPMVELSVLKRWGMLSLVDADPDFTPPHDAASFIQNEAA